ncbi:MAG: pyridoxamine 5'-phosphate oxidase [Hyphomicrobiaceae bacterium]|nr:pyridoxamine 5'-phosphate oxidase [Hyphomicrobiaceae bacterium]
MNKDGERADPLQAPGDWTEPGPDIDLAAFVEPFELFEAWLQEASVSEINDPNAMALATVDREGLPNVRMVLLKGVDEADAERRGFVFYTNTQSAKGTELAGSPKAAAVIHWKSLRRQVRVRGPVETVSADEADAYFASRPRGSRIGAWASDQSRPLDSRSLLEQRVAEIAERHGAGTIPRPPHWTGFRIVPVEIEFWQDRPFRLHNRMVFRRPGPGLGWQTARLYP